MGVGKRTVLITGCSDGGLGAELALAFHEAGLHVYATARNPAKMKQVQAKGIQTLQLDVLDDASIAACVREIPSLDILVNNAGAGYNMPVSDIVISEARKLFDLNVWSYIAVTQAFLPLILESKGMIVHNTSVASVIAMPYASVYNASKAAMALFADTQRLELEVFGVRVIELKTGAVKSNFFDNTLNRPTEEPARLPKGSIYEPAREPIEFTLSGENMIPTMAPSDAWAKGVVSDLLKTSPPSRIWRGGSAGLVRLATTLAPHGWLDGLVKKECRADVAEKLIIAANKQ